MAINSSSMGFVAQSLASQPLTVATTTTKATSTAIAFLNATVHQNGESQTGNIPCSSYALTPYLLDTKENGLTAALEAAIKYISEMKMLDAEGKQIMIENTKEKDKLIRDLLNKIIDNPKLHGKVCKRETWIDPETGEEILTLESSIQVNKPKTFRKVIRLK